MKATEFSGFICDWCHKPFTIEAAEGTAWHLQGSIGVNNMQFIEDKDYCSIECLKDHLNLIETGAAYAND